MTCVPHHCVSHIVSLFIFGVSDKIHLSHLCTSHFPSDTGCHRGKVVSTGAWQQESGCFICFFFSKSQLQQACVYMGPLQVWWAPPQKGWPFTWPTLFPLSFWYCSYFSLFPNITKIFRNPCQYWTVHNKHKSPPIDNTNYIIYKLKNLYNLAPTACHF